MKRSISAIAYTVGSLVLLFGVTVVTAASPTVFGPSGLLTTPTADTEDLVTLRLGGWYVSDFGETASLTSGAGTSGEGSTAWVNETSGDSKFLFSAKWRFRSNSVRQPSMAVGIIDISDQIELTPYVVVQKGLHLGGYGVTATAGYAKPNSLLDGFFGGADVTLSEKLHLLGEYDGNDINAGIRIPLNDRLEITAGMINDEFAASAVFRIR